jgi:copper chaperone CopZ
MPTYSAAYTVSGMTCDHCVRAVAEELRKLPGVQDVQVQLNPGGNSAVQVESASPLDDTAVGAAVDEAGYALA